VAHPVFTIIPGVGADAVARPFGVSVLGGCVYRAIQTKKILGVRVVIRGSDIMVCLILYYLGQNSSPRVWDIR